MEYDDLEDDIFHNFSTQDFDDDEDDYAYDHDDYIIDQLENND